MIHIAAEYFYGQFDSRTLHNKVNSFSKSIENDKKRSKKVVFDVFFWNLSFFLFILQLIKLRKRVKFNINKQIEIT